MSNAEKNKDIIKDVDSEQDSRYLGYYSACDDQDAYVKTSETIVKTAEQEKKCIKKIFNNLKSK